MSTIIIRLQNLPLSAKAADIREFFGDLKIPKGSVNIVGGPQGDAFIGFASDEDARLAMLLDGRLLHNSKIHLMLSSRREMEQVIAAAQVQAQSVKAAVQLPVQHQTAPQMSAMGELNVLMKKELMPVKPEVLGPPALPSSSSSLSAHSQPGSYGVSTAQPQYTAAVPAPVLQQAQQPSIQLKPPVSFSGDSWKNPQQQPNLAFPSPQVGLGLTQQQQQQQQPTIHQQVPPQVPTANQQQLLQSQAPVFPSTQFGVPPPQVQPQHQYQQLPQPPGFPPPIVPPPQMATGGFQQPPPNLPRPPPFFVPPPQQQQQQSNQLQQTGGGNNPPRFVPPHFASGNQQFFGGPPPPHGQQQPYFGGPAGPGNQFRPNQPQQPFARRPPFAGQQGQQQQQPSFGVQQRQQCGTFRAPFGQQPHFGAQLNQQQSQNQQFGGGRMDGGKRSRRSRSPDDGQNQAKRLNVPSNKLGGSFGFGNQGQGVHQQQQLLHQFQPNQRQEKQRICVQLSNVPYKATYEDIQEYLSTAKAKCIKCTRVYMPDRNFSDRWIVEFDNEEDARAVCKYRGEIVGRTIKFKIRAERIPPRRADEQYAVMEPDDRDTANNEPRRPRREGRRGGSRDRDRANRSRSPRVRNRSRDGVDREREEERREHQSGREKRRDVSEERGERRSASRERRKRSGSREDRNDRNNEPQRGSRDSPPKMVEKSSAGANKESSSSLMSVHSAVVPAPSQPVPLFGAFAFPGTQTSQGVYNAKSGTTVQLGAKDGMKAIPPLRAAFDIQPPQFFPTLPSTRPPPLLNGGAPFIANGSGAGGNGSNNLPSPPSPSGAGGQPQFRPHNIFQAPHQQQPNIPVTCNFWPTSRSATGANASPLGQRPAAGGGGGGGPQPPQQAPSNPSIFSSIEGSGLDLVIDMGSVDGEGDEGGSCNPGPGEQPCGGGNREVVARQSENPPNKSSLSTTFSAVPDQPPLDLLEPEGESPHQPQSNQPVFSSPPTSLSSNWSRDAIRAHPPSIPVMPVATAFRSFDSIPSGSRTQQQQQQQEFSQQEVEFRPHLLFLGHYWQDPNSKSCIRLENVPKMVFVEQLSDFLGAKIESPCQNIARMFNGVLYINLESEVLAARAASRNGQFLDGHQIGITQLRKSEMADAIRQNMIIIREMYRVTVVARGFPLTMQPTEVVALFERFNLGKDGVEKCAIRSTDSISTFLLTFPGVQDCRNAIAELNGAQVGDARLEVFQPEGLTF